MMVSFSNLLDPSDLGSSRYEEPREIRSIKWKKLPREEFRPWPDPSMKKRTPEKREAPRVVGSYPELGQTRGSPEVHYHIFHFSSLRKIILSLYLLKYFVGLSINCFWQMNSPHYKKRTNSNLEIYLIISWVRLFWQCASNKKEHFNKLQNETRNKFTFWNRFWIVFNASAAVIGRNPEANEKPIKINVRVTIFLIVKAWFPFLQCEILKDRQSLRKWKI